MTVLSNVELDHVLERTSMEIIETNTTEVLSRVVKNLKDKR